MKKLTNLRVNPNQRHKCHHLATTLHLTLKITTTRVVEMSVTNTTFTRTSSRKINGSNHLPLKYMLACHDNVAHVLISDQGQSSPFKL